MQAFRLLREWDLLSIVHERFGAGVPFLDLLAATAAAHAEARGLRGDGGGATQAEAGWLAVAAAIPAEDREARVRLIPGGRAAQRRFREGPERVAAAVGRLARAWRPSYAAGALGV